MFEVVIGTEIDPETGDIKDPNLLIDDLESKNQAALYAKIVEVDLWATYGEISSMDPKEDKNKDGVPDKQEKIMAWFAHIATVGDFTKQATGVAPAIQRNP